MFPFIIPALFAAVGAAVGAIATHAAGEEDRQKAKHLNQTNNDLINKQNDLEKRYYQLKDRNNQEVNDLNYKLAKSELEKDTLFLAIRLQNHLVSLMQEIDGNPSFEVLIQLRKAIEQTNVVLRQLGENPIPISQDYFDRNFERTKEKNLTETQQFILKQNTNFSLNETPYAHQQKLAIDEVFSRGLVSYVEEKTTSIIVGTIACPHCHHSNEVMKKTPSIRCSVCNKFIDLVARHSNIQWNIQPNQNLNQKSIVEDLVKYLKIKLSQK
jgi:hypothetical protein